MKKARKQKWFKQVRGSYLPNTWQGWLTYIPYTAYLIGPLLLVLRNKSDFWTALFILVPNWIVALIVMQWVAARRS